MKRFTSAGAFAAHLTRLALEGREVIPHTTEKVAEIIRDNARDRIGHYQEQVGPFPGWRPLAPSTEAEKKRLGYPTGAPLLREGDLRDSIGVVAKGNEAQIGSNDPKAAWQELGTSRIPPRPFIGPAAIDSKPKAERTMAAVLVAWVAGIGWRRPQISMPGTDGKK